MESVKTDDEDVECSLYYDDQLLETKSGDKTEFIIDDPKLWSAEIPQLYTLYIKLKKGINVLSA